MNVLLARTITLVLTMRRTAYRLLSVLLVLAIGKAQAQSDKVYHPMIHTLQTIVNDDWLHDDAVTLGSEGELFSVSFLCIYVDPAEYSQVL